MQNNNLKKRPMARLVTFVVLLAFTVLYLPVVASDKSVFDEQMRTGGCCGWVENNVLVRPYTYASVSWREPVWKKNAIGTELWLTSEGYVDGEEKFWRLLERKPIAE